MSLPSLNTIGSWTLKSPWSVNPEHVYRCIAIRYLTDLLLEGVDVVETYYQPKGLSKTEYEQDLENGVALITLEGVDQETVYVPSSYIESYPSNNTIPYNRIILAVDLGPLPDTDDVEYLKTQISGVIETAQGVAPDIEVLIAPMEGVVTEQQHQAFMQARAAARKNRVSDYQMLRQSQDLLERVRSHKVELEKLYLKHYNP